MYSREEDKTKSVWISDDREYYKYLVYIIDVDITTLRVEGTITPTKYMATNTVSSSIAFNIMNELLRKECDVSCNFIFLSNCMTKWFLHSLGIIYWRGFELLLLSFFLLSCCYKCHYVVHIITCEVLVWCIGTHLNDSKIIWLMKIKMARDYFTFIGCCYWSACFYIHPVGIITFKKECKEMA